MSKILVVDDSKILREDLKEIFLSAGYQVIEAENGLIALNQIKKNLDIDIIILDINMPEMDGITMCEEIYQNKNLKNIPIVILTTEAKMELKETARNLGVKAWVTKPFIPEKILLGVEQILKEVE